MKDSSLELAFISVDQERQKIRDGVDPDVRSLKLSLRDLETTLLDLYNLFQMIGSQLKSRQYTKSQLADLGYLFRECEKVLDDRRKDAMAFKSLTGKTLALMVMQDADSLNDANADDTIRGTIARATVDLKMVPKIPKKGTPEFYALLGAMGLDPDMVDPNKGGVFSINWKKAVEVATARLEAGEKPIPGLTDLHPSYGAVFTSLTRKVH